ncbi:MAG TPA: HGGxSTG domain-containing protein [Bryobacteraceae bacterium]
MSKNSPLKNGNRQGDFRNAPRCGAKTRRGTACRCPAICGRLRCRVHGGWSTGPRTPEGIEHIRKANTTHGAYTAKARAERARIRHLLAQFHSLVQSVTATKS